MSIRTEVRKASVEVSVEAGGDHQFDIGHLRRQGAPALVQLLLQSSGYGKAIRWRVRVEKKISCNAETKPVTIVGSKAWCCYLKIKPGDNNTAHFCSLLMPDGYRGEVVYEALKEAEERVCAAWWAGFEGKVAPPMESDDDMSDDKNGDNGTLTTEDAAQAMARELALKVLGETAAPAAAETVAAAPEPPPPPPAEPEPEPAANEAEDSELWGWTQDEEQVRLTLYTIHQIQAAGRTKNLDEFVAALANQLGWQKLRRKQIGGIFTALVRRGHIRRLRHGSLALAYELTEQGQQLIHDVLDSDKKEVTPPPVVAAPPAPPVAVLAPPPVAAPSDSTDLLTALTERTRAYIGASEKLKEIRARRAQLVGEIERLDAETANLTRLVSNPEVRTLLTRLLQLTGGAGP